MSCFLIKMSSCAGCGRQWKSRCAIALVCHQDRQVIEQRWTPAQVDKLLRTMTACLTPDRSEGSPLPKATLFLLGDSHAENLRGGLALAARAHDGPPLKAAESLRGGPDCPSHDIDAEADKCGWPGKSRPCTSR